MKHFIIVEILLLGVATTAFSEDPVEAWVSRYDGPSSNNDHACAIASDPEGNIYIAGYSETSYEGDFDYLTVKYNSAGVLQWSASYNGPGDDNDIAYDIAIDSAGNAYVTGASTGISSTDYVTIKYSSSGQLQWIATYNGPANSADQAQAIHVDSFGNAYVTGYSYSGSGSDYATVKYNSDGVQQWASRYNGPGYDDDDATDIAVDSAGYIYVTGHSFGNGSNRDYATIKYTPSGQQQWVARYNGPGNLYDYASDLYLDAAGNAYVTGQSIGIGTNQDFATVKYSTNGTEEWVARYNRMGGSIDAASALVVDASGNVYVTGATGTSQGAAFDYATIKYSADGSQLWAALYNGPGNGIDWAQGIVTDASGYVYVTGYSPGSGYNSDYATIKYNPAGEQQWIVRYNGPADEGDSANGIVLDALGNVIVTGSSNGGASGYDIATIMYAQNTGVEQHETNPNPGIRVFPIPTHDTATLEVSLPEPAECSLKIFDICGRLMEVLHEGALSGGEHVFEWHTSSFPAGVYLVRISAGSLEATARVVLAR